MDSSWVLAAAAVGVVVWLVAMLAAYDRVEALGSTFADFIVKVARDLRGYTRTVAELRTKTTLSKPGQLVSLALNEKNDVGQFAVAALAMTTGRSRERAIHRLLKAVDRERCRELRTQQGEGRPQAPTIVDTRPTEILVAMRAVEALPRLKRMLANTPSEGEYYWSYGTEGTYSESYPLASYAAILRAVDRLKAQ